MFKSIFSIWASVAVMFQLQSASATDCSFMKPIKSSGPLFGLIMVPGGRINGESYTELANNMQLLFPGRLWIGLGTDFPLGLPSESQLPLLTHRCLQKAGSEVGNETLNLFLAGHSLGGQAAGAFLYEHPTQASGLILFSAYLEDSLFDPQSLFPLPTIHICGQLDGQVVTLMPKKYIQSQKAEQKHPDAFPVVLVERTNHHQVASHEPPSEKDIISEVSETEAHLRYAEAAITFMVAQHAKVFQPNTWRKNRRRLQDLRTSSENFLQPFLQARALEGTDAQHSPWALEAQKILCGDKLERLKLANVLHHDSSIIYSQPELLRTGECWANLTTHTYNEYDRSLGVSLQSSSTIKAKLKLERAVREALCLSQQELKEAKDVNEAAFTWAFDQASEEARERYRRRGRQLRFTHDQQMPSAPEFLMTKLTFQPTTDPRIFEMGSAVRITKPGVSEFDNNHYMNLLSPYRALEWIYIIGLRKGFVV